MASMESKSVYIHIGQLVKEELEKQERSVTWFAKNIYTDRTNVYRIFSKKSLDCEILFKISNVLHRNFFLEYVKVYDELLMAKKDEQ